MLPKYKSGAARKRVLYLLGGLLAINAVVAHIVTNQIASASGENQVKEEQVVIEEASEITDEEEMGSDEGQETPKITIYTVKSGDTISTVADKFGISGNTIRWANEIGSKDTIRVGQTLVVLSIDGIQYTVKSGDTISGIAKKFNADSKEILSFNAIDDAAAIKPGVDLIIPDAEPIKPVAKPAAPKPTPKPIPSSQEDKKPALSSKDTSKENTPKSPSSSSGTFTHPVPGSVLTQGYHAVNAVDFGAKTGTPVLAVASGTVIVAKGSGAHNGGFGNMIVISHDDGSQTLYAHLSKVEVSVGDSVDKGERVGLVGNTGRSTGPHLHFEVHSAKNPWTKDKKYTKY